MQRQQRRSKRKTFPARGKCPVFWRLYSLPMQSILWQNLTVSSQDMRVCGPLLDEGEITNVSVKASGWGNGIGRQLVEVLLDAGKKAGVSSFYLEVRQSNERAISLYRSCGFEEAGIRKNFYEAPKEHAVVMCKR